MDQMTGQDEANRDNLGKDSRTDEGKNPAASSNHESPGNEVPEWVVDPERAYAEIQKLREEAKQLRTLKQQIEAQKREELEQQGEFKALYEQLKAKQDALEKQLETERQMQQIVADPRFQQLPQGVQQLLKGSSPDEALSWLEANAHEFNRPKAPATDAGVQGDRSSGALKLTPEQLEMAAKFGITPERYAEQLQRRQS